MDELVSELKKYIFDTYINHVISVRKIKKYWFEDDYKSFIITFSEDNYMICIDVKNCEVFLLVRTRRQVFRSLLCKDDINVELKLRKLIKIYNKGCE